MVLLVPFSLALVLALSPHDVSPSLSSVKFTFNLRGFLGFESSVLLELESDDEDVVVPLPLLLVVLLSESELLRGRL